MYYVKKLSAFQTYIFLLFLFCLPLNMSVHAETQPVLIAQSYYEDPTSTLTFETIRQKEFMPYKGLFNKGYSSSTFWIRLDFVPTKNEVNGEASHQPFVLRLMPSFLDTIEIIDPEEPSDTPRLTGNRHPGKNDEYRSNNFNFVINDISHPKSIWLRVKTNSTTIVSVELLPFAKAALLDTKQNFFFGIYFGIILLSALGTLYIYFLNKDRVVLVFSIKQISQLVWSLFNIGYFRFFFDEFSMAISIADFRHFPGSATVLLSMIFDYLFLREFGSRRWVRSIQLGVIGFEIISVFCLIIGATQLGLKLNVIAIWAATITSLIAALTLPAFTDRNIARTGNVPKGLLIACYGFIMLIISSAAFAFMGVPGATQFSINAFIYHGLISALAVAALLGYRARSQIVLQFELSKALQISERVAEEERANRREQSRFLSMLSHELKTPLAGIKLVLGLRAERDKNDILIERAVDDIDNVIKICLEVEKVDDGVVEFQKTTQCLQAEFFHDLVTTSDRERLVITLEGQTQIVTDPRYFSIVMSNVVLNALKYSPEGSPVEIIGRFETNEGRKGYAVTIVNEPINGDFPDKALVFSKYYRSPLAHRKTGSGLGLYLVSQLCRMLGCVVRYEPDERFVRFVVWFPV